MARADASELPAGLADDLRQSRVGGTYWATQPELPANFILIRSVSALEAASDLAEGRPVVLWTSEVPKQRLNGVQQISGDCDPWHVLSSAAAVVLEHQDELRTIAALLCVPAWLWDGGRVAQETCDVERLLADALPASSFDNPFTGELMSLREAIQLSAFWRQLIDSNRDISEGFGFAFWKQDQVAALLWNGHEPFRFLRGADEVTGSGPVAIWRAKIGQSTMDALERKGPLLIEVEDGFLRSRGLGADCIPPLSITVDRLGAYFDPAKPSELEALLQDAKFDAPTLVRARKLRHLLVVGGIGKYEQGGPELERRVANRRHILVPGQVEDDRAVQSGGCGLVSNLDLLKRVREQAPDAYILYKPHPDVVAGHRKGAIADRLALEYADETCGKLPIASFIAMVDEVHVNTSLAGFEALMHGKKVSAYGVPFYAGWGLTADLGPVPARRTAKRTLDELVAATLLMYPRYLDPVTGLPCPAEIVVDRLSLNEDGDSSLLVGMRRLQGKLMRRLRSLVQ